MQFLSKFRQTSRIGMLKTVIKVKLCCAVVFYEEIIAVFMLKSSQIGTEIDKKPKFFKVFMQFLSNLWQTSWIGMLKRVNLKRVCCLVVFYEEIIAVF